VSATKTAIVLDDHPLVARGIANFLQSHCNFSTVKTVFSANDFWSALCDGEPPNLVLLDFWLPDGMALALLEPLKSKHPTIPVLVISADDDFIVQQKVQAAGAQGFINKQATPDIFMLAVSSLLKNKTWFKKSIYSQAPKELTVTAHELGLTARQGEVLALILLGLPNKRIAQTLSLSEQTVKEHVSGILSRLGVGNRIEAITKLRGKELLPKSYE